MKGFKAWLDSGSPWVWLQAAAVSVSILLVTGLLLLIAMRGLGHFWPATVVEWLVVNDQGAQRTLVGQLRRSEEVDATRLREAGIALPERYTRVQRHLLKTGNRDLQGVDFTWVVEPQILKRSEPANLVVLEREKWGVLYGRLVGIRENDRLLDNSPLWQALEVRLERVDKLRRQIDELEKDSIVSVNYRLRQSRLDERALRLRAAPGAPPDEPALSQLQAEQADLQAELESYAADLDRLLGKISRDVLVMQTADGNTVEVPLGGVLDAYQPNRMGAAESATHYLRKLGDFLFDEPREANTEGGIYPAIFGTVLMVILMSLVVTPLGVLAAVYLHEYAYQGWITRFIRISVNNLAGVPSIVYGVFGLGFFIYVIGGGIDSLFFSEALPTATFGTGGLFWASLTLALLTLPVVIVATEEGLARVPKAVREGSLALGATQWETLTRTVLPMASPGIMTGVILAVARAAGEVAPLMLVGVVKLAASLPLDGDFPFLHLERKFMHLGFHIYDVGFQSPNVEAARPTVYATALLLVLITLLLNIVAISIRNRLRERYRTLEAQ